MYSGKPDEFSCVVVKFWWKSTYKYMVGGKLCVTAVACVATQISRFYFQLSKGC